MKVYLVGGAVRDTLLGIEPKERDWVVVGATPEQMRELGYRPVGKDFPVFLHPQTHEEYALARTERKTAPGYHGFVFHADSDVTLEQDLRRRDLTINAMAMTGTGEIIDPYGGRDDLEQGVLRHVSEAFGEDPVRILRVARFAARFAHWGFRVSHATHALMKKMVEAGEVDALVPERVWQETHKALGERTPSRYFRVLHACGALDRLFPELSCLFNVPQPASFHPEGDAGIHSLMVLDAAAAMSPLTRIRFAALTHDLGKGGTPRSQWPRHRGHEHRGVDLIAGLCRRLRAPNDHCDLAMLVAEHHGECRRAADAADPAAVLGLLERADAFRRPQRFAEFLIACEADLRGRAGFGDRDFAQPQLFRRALAAAAAVNAGDLAAGGLKGAAIAAALHRRRLEEVTRVLAA